jgi:hypothetical protein
MSSQQMKIHACREEKKQEWEDWNDMTQCARAWKYLGENNSGEKRRLNEPLQTS